MRIAVYTLTRDRLRYTQECFASLRANAGHPYDHYVVDNGSTDGTHGWLVDDYKPHWIWPLDENAGISRASNIALRAVMVGNYDLIVKMDNDCMVQREGILAEFARIYHDDPHAHRYALSPRVEGINRQPTRYRHQQVAGHSVGLTPIIGGLFHVLPVAMYRHYYTHGGYPETLPLAKGQDDHLCEWLRVNGYLKGYVEDLTVAHHETTDGQAARYPEYFERKWKEELSDGN
jgi:glycosyltransferase involved in cell wall biosynthesis